MTETEFDEVSLAQGGVFVYNQWLSESQLFVNTWNIKEKSNLNKSSLMRQNERKI